MRRILSLMILIASCGLLPAQGLLRHDDAVIARVNGEALLLSQVTESMILDNPAAVREPLNYQNDTFRKALTRKIDEMLLVQHAQREELTIDDEAIAREVDQQMGELDSRHGSVEELDAVLASMEMDRASLRRMLQEQQKRQLLASQVVAHRVSIESAEVDRFKIELRRDKKPLELLRLGLLKFECPAARQATAEGREIYRSALAAAAEAGTHPGSFADIARKYVSDKALYQMAATAQWYEPGQLLPEVRETVRSLKPGQVSEPVVTSEGFMVLKLVDVKDARELLFEQKYEKARNELVASLRAQSDLELYQ